MLGFSFAFACLCSVYLLAWLGAATGLFFPESFSSVAILFDDVRGPDGSFCSVTFEIGLAGTLPRWPFRFPKFGAVLVETLVVLVLPATFLERAIGLALFI